MNKRIFTALLAAVLCIGVFGTALADGGRIGTSWKSKDVVIRTSTTTDDPGNQGFIDSLQVTIGGLSSIDTSAALNIPDIANATVDSLQFIRVEAIGTNAFASGESLYVTFDGWTGSSFADLGLATCGTCNAGGFGAAGSLVPGTNFSASRLWNGAGSATAVHVAAGLAPAGPGRSLVYGNFGGYPVIRMRVRTDSAVVPVANTVRFRIWYLANDSNVGD